MTDRRIPAASIATLLRILDTCDDLGEFDSPADPDPDDSSNRGW